MDKFHNPNVKRISGGIEAARKNINNNVGAVYENVDNLKGNFQ